MTRKLQLKKTKQKATAENRPLQIQSTAAVLSLKPRVTPAQQLASRQKYVWRELKRSLVIAGILIVLLIVLYLFRDWVGI